MIKNEYLDCIKFEFSYLYFVIKYDLRNFLFDEGIDKFDIYMYGNRESLC